ncbi:MAG: DUF2934 domain-containing protein [Proteobacteria bacterium]|nr:DUF2934 domain-containing protein [Pseudomonadota bacterium]
MPSPEIEQRIRDRAYYIWLEEGAPPGRSVEHWLRAEAELRAKGQVRTDGPKSAPPARPANPAPLAPRPRKKTT